MFPLLAANPDCLLTTGATDARCAAIAGNGDGGRDDGTMPLDSTIPAVFTYLGQFIDHNITAQTDREIGVSRIATPDGNVMDITPLPSSEVVEKLVNGRRRSSILIKCTATVRGLEPMQAPLKAMNSSILQRWSSKSSPMRPVSMCPVRTTERRSSPTCATMRISTSVSCTAGSYCSTIRSRQDCQPAYQRPALHPRAPARALGVPVHRTQRLLTPRL